MRQNGLIITGQVDGSTGPVVILMSGLDEPHESWRAVAPTIARCARVLRYDRPGTGGSKPVPKAPVLAQRVASELMDILRALTLPPPYVLVAHSIAGLYAQAFAKDYPQETAGMVLVDATSPLEPPGVFISTQPPPEGSTAAMEEAGVSSSILALNTRRDFADIPLIVLAATDHQDTPDRERLWLDLQRRTAMLSPRGKLVIAQGSGHFIQADRPELVIDAVLDLLTMTGASVSGCSTLQ
ncbi:alpha/beta fold hydrolase [Rhodoligotrophos ferricapiens]|uniref:alpha/beta fold hydrolase n=1 Tax=Rhodoligotrophos ferricapiens TaxID=3069264 RepID=UPI00315D8BA8